MSHNRRDLARRRWGNVPRSGAAWSLAALSLATTACAPPPIVQVSLLRPARWTVVYSRTMRLAVVVDGETDALALAQIADSLRSMIERGANPQLRLGTPPDLTVHAHVLRDEYTEMSDHRVDGVGRFTYASTVRVGRSVSVIEFRLEDARGNIVQDVVLDQYSDIDWPMGRVHLVDARGLVVDTFERYLEPYTTSQTLEFGRCMLDSRCRRGIEDVQRYDFETADDEFSAVIDSLQGRPLDRSERRRLADALRNRALVRAVDRDFARARLDLAHVDAVQPHAHATETTHATIDRLERDARELHEQGVTP